MLYLQNQSNIIMTKPIKSPFFSCCITLLCFRKVTFLLKRENKNKKNKHYEEKKRIGLHPK